VSGDKIHLAIYAAVAETGATEADSDLLLAALRQEQSENPVWPKDFMPEI
jgi:hypothetical protein